jgi:hypothetical protein
MKNNTPNKTENKELTSYQKLLINLDDDAKAYDFKVKTLDHAKNLISDILSVTTGNSVVTEDNSEWGHGNLLELFEMLLIRHKNFDVPDFLENLSDFLFTWTFTSDEANRNWKKKTLTERGLDEYGIPFQAEQPKVLAESEKTSEPIKTDTACENRQTEPTAQPKAKTLDEHHLQIMANKLSHILGSDKVSGDAKEALQSILCEMSNEANLGLDSPEIIKTSFPLLVGSLEFEHGKGFVHALRALLDSGLVSPIEDELRQYEKRFDSTENQTRALDLPDSSIEDLAGKLSEIMDNPNLPKVIQDCLEDNLNINHIDFYTPENILGNLKSLAEESEAQNE